MAELMDWKMLINDQGYIGICGCVQNHPRHPDGTRITYTSKLEELEAQEDGFVFSTKTVSYTAPFSEYSGVSEIQFLHGTLVSDVYRAFDQIAPSIGADLYQILLKKQNGYCEPVSSCTDIFSP